MTSTQRKDNQQSTTQDTFIDQKLLERVEQTRAIKSQEFAQIQKQSYILQNPMQNEEKAAAKSIMQQNYDLEGLQKRIEKYQQQKLEANTLSWMDKRYWKYIIKNNVDLFSLWILESSIMVGVYPLLTLKTRIQAKHITEDICFFFKNNAKKTPLYHGVSQAIYSLTLGNIVNNSVYRLAAMELQDNSITKNWGFNLKNTIAYCIGDIASAPFRAPFEVKRMLVQMNVQNQPIESYYTAVRRAVFPLLIRDIIFRSTFNFFYNFGLHSEYYWKLFTSQSEEEKKYIQSSLDRQTVSVSYQKQSSCMMISSFLAIVVSNPIDVVLTRLSCQQYAKYTGFFNCMKTIYKEEGASKLFLSGYGYRVGFYLVNGSVMLNCYDKFRNMVSEAYN